MCQTPKVWSHQLDHIYMRFGMTQFDSASNRDPTGHIDPVRFSTGSQNALAPTRRRSLHCRWRRTFNLASLLLESRRWRTETSGVDPMASKLLLQRRLFRFLQLSPPFFSSIHAAPTILSAKASEFMFLYNVNALLPPLSPSRNFCSRSFNLHESQGPLTIDYRYDVHFLVFHLLYSYLILRNHKKLNSMVLAFKFQFFFFKFLILKFEELMVLAFKIFRRIQMSVTRKFLKGCCNL